MTSTAACPMGERRCDATNKKNHRLRPYVTQISDLATTDDDDDDDENENNEEEEKEEEEDTTSSHNRDYQKRRRGEGERVVMIANYVVPSSSSSRSSTEERLPLAEHEDNDTDTGYRMSVEAHLKDDDDDNDDYNNDDDDDDDLWRDELDDSLEEEEEEEESVRSWRSWRSWRYPTNHRGGKHNNTATATTTTTSPQRKVEIYVDIAEDTSLPRPSSASAIRSNNAINPPLRRQDDTTAAAATTTTTTAVPHDLASLLAAVPSVTSPTTTTTTAPDAFSIQSKTVFEREDFAQSYWSAALTTNSGYVGLAVIALTISVTHPLLFLAAALTALGTATAVGASYDYLVECGKDPCYCCGAAGVAGDLDDDVNADSILSPTANDHIVVKTRPTTTTAGATISNTENKASCTPPTTTAAADAAAATSTDPLVITPAPSLPLDDNQNDTKGRLLSAEWLDAHFPPLEFPVLQNSKLEGLNVVQFFDVFFSDTAPYNFREFQLKRGDKNVQYGCWTPVTRVAGQALSLHPAAPATDTARAITPRSWLARELHFQAKTNNTFIGPPYATTTKLQQCWIWSKKMAVLEMKTTLRDIPFCDRFHVLERWMLAAEKDKDGIYHLQISSTASVIFEKACPFTSQIQTKSRASLTDVGRAWYHMAKQALSMAKQAKLDRLHQQEEEEEEDEDLVEETETSKQRPLTIVPEQSPIMSAEPSDYVEEKKEDDFVAAPAAALAKDENIELVHSFTRQLSWVVGEEEPAAPEQDKVLRASQEEEEEEEGLVVMDGPMARARSLRRFLPRRPPRVSSIVSSSGTPRTKQKNCRLARESSADF